MTALTHLAAPADAQVPDGVDWPEPDTVVLAKRPLTADTDIDTLSRFADDVWYLTPGIFEDNAKSTRINFAAMPEPFRLDAKYYIWQLINNEGRPTGWPALNTTAHASRALRTFMEWLIEQGVTAFAQVTLSILDDYLTWVGAQEIGLTARGSELLEVRRLWSYRSVLPPRMRLPAPEPWDGETISDLLGRARPRAENRTPRIREQTMQPLLSWAMRFVEDFAEDIISAWHEHAMLTSRTRKDDGRAGTAHLPGELRLKVEAYLDRLRERGEPLPGTIGSDGVLGIDWPHLSRVLDCNRSLQLTRTARLIVESGLPVAPGAILDAPITGQLDGRPWRETRIHGGEALGLARMLSAACLTIICYLSGARPGEVLSLRRGCLQRDDANGLWLMRGRYWKGAKDAKGNKIPEGQIRDLPWVVVDVVATAVRVLERLHTYDLLFPSRLTGPISCLRNQGLATDVAANHLNAFVTWVNEYCQAHGRTDVIPPDGRLACSRFRRTLAWFIRRRPRGLIAASLQYGHAETMILQGYAGTYESGFPDDYAFEDWLFRMEVFADDERRLADGEHVSGPAADDYRQRVHQAATEFAGLVVTNGERARKLLTDRRLQIFHGEGMTCVFRQETAACERRPALGDPEATPDTDDCRPHCPNLARTDRDIGSLRTQAAELEEIVADPLAPPIRHRRDLHRLQRFHTIIDTHETGKHASTP